MKFIEGACEKIPLPDKSVDLVVSFETLEHFEDHNHFIFEIQRVLVPGGLLVISTPEKSAYSDKSAHSNEFHKKELYQAEFSELLHGAFRYIAIFGQKIAYGSQLAATQGASSGFVTYDFAKMPENLLKIRGLNQAVYLVAVCSHHPLPAILDSLCEQAIWESEKMKSMLREKDAELAARIQEGRNEIALLREKDRESNVRLQEVENFFIHLKAVEDSFSGKLLPKALVRLVALWKTASIALPSWILPNPSERAKNKKVGFWKRLERSIRKRRKRWIGRIGFDRDWYLKEYPDVAHAGIDPLDHYVGYGILEGRWKSRKDKLRTPNPQETGGLQGWEGGRFTNQLDRYVRNIFGQSTQERVSNLLDQLLQEENRADPEAFRKQKIRKLECRLVEALRNRPSMTEKPKVSIIVPVYNQVAHTLACAISLYESDPASTFELIIADDCSTDETKEIFGRLHPNVRVVRTKENFGFLRNSNHAAKSARGEFLVFLNNDMVVLPGWLDEMMETFVMHSNCGMCGSKLLNLDGTLQEAGGIYWNDGSAWNYGRGKNPESSEFNYQKEVDYCSGASICLRKSVWDSHNGFDESYAPAYCEEADLAFCLRSRGLQTIYQPDSVGIHLEGVSHGTDKNHGIKQHQIKNMQKILIRWSEVLKKEHFANGEKVFFARDRSARKKHILFVDHYVPQYDKDAGSRQADAYLRLFVRKGFQVILWPDNLQDDQTYSKRYQQLGIEVINNNSSLADFKRWAVENGPLLDFALLCRPHIAPAYYNSLRQHSHCRIAYYGHDLHAERIKREKQVFGANTVLIENIDLIQNMEMLCWKQADVVLYPSEDECRHVRKMLPGVHAGVLPLYCVEEKEVLIQRSITNRDQRSTNLLFVGGFVHRPNADGLLWFYKNIYPIILKRIPDVKLTVVGSNTPSEIRELNSTSCSVLGYISDEELNNIYNQSLVVVAPLRYGAGVKGKIVEALLKGVPVVTTPSGIQGLENCEECIAVADSVEDFADNVCRLLTDPVEWECRRNSGFSYFDKHFAEEAVWSKIKSLFI
jgi:GT2 family glycosyltransferase